MTLWTGLGLLALAVWLYLLLARGGFWLARERDEAAVPAPRRWPAVVAVVPARNEADVIARSIGSLLSQDYAGPFRIVLVDDGSSDGTAAVARSVDRAINGQRRLDVLAGASLPAGWTGKLWALEQGIRHATAAGDAVDYVLLTDADIGHAPDNLSQLIARAERDGRVQISLMAELSCASLAERFLIPAFVYFFQMLYPFSWVARRDRRTAAAAGGCTLVRRELLPGIGRRVIGDIVGRAREAIEGEDRRAQLGAHQPRGHRKILVPVPLAGGEVGAAHVSPDMA
jgi:hopene-associated glycosyltransferase HpnB